MPVALHVEDHLRARAGDATRDKKRDRLVDALDERGIRPEVAQLARDPPRQQRVVQRAVERARARRPDEMKAVVARRRPGRGRREHAVVDDVRDRVPLPFLRAVERQPEPLARDEKHTRLHAPATSSTRSAQCAAECSAATRARSSGPAPPV